jgi:hypothetical protein
MMLGNESTYALLLQSRVTPEIDMACDALEQAGIPFKTKRVIPRSIRNTLAYYTLSSDIHFAVHVPEADYENALSIVSELPINPDSYNGSYSTLTPVRPEIRQTVVLSFLVFAILYLLTIITGMTL